MVASFGAFAAPAQSVLATPVFGSSTGAQSAYRGGTTGGFGLRGGGEEGGDSDEEEEGKGGVRMKFDSISLEQVCLAFCFELVFD